MSEIEISTELLAEIRDKFAHIDHCSLTGKRVFFENAGGALTLKSVVECASYYAGIPDNEGRDNPTSRKLTELIQQAKGDMAVFMNAPGGQFFVGETGTELLFRLIRAACLGTAEGSRVLGSTLEHPSSRSGCARWSATAGHSHVLVPHDNQTGTVEAAHYASHVTSNTRVATIVHTSPVTGMNVDLAAVAAAIRQVSPQCYIIVDGIQHAAHGSIDLASYDVDAYVISPYKVFSRHGYGIAWISERMNALPHDSLTGSPAEKWELGTRDVGSYATFVEVIRYFEWLGDKVGRSNGVGDQDGRREKFVAAAKAIQHQENQLAEAMIHGTDKFAGLTSMPQLHVVGGTDNARRAGLISFWVEDIDSADIVSYLNEQRIRTHTRKADNYSSNVLAPLNIQHCVRVSMCHYNTREEVAMFLGAMHGFFEERA